jgi:hypothetical protein
MAESKKGTAGEPENKGGAEGGEKLSGGVPPTGDKAPESVLKVHEELAEQHAAPATVDPLYNPTTPDGSPPPNNLPGPHGPQGVEHLQVDVKDL